MPIFSLHQKPRPSGAPADNAGGTAINPATTITSLDTRSPRDRLHDLLFGHESETKLPPVSDLSEEQATAILADPAPIVAFQHAYCVLPPDGLFDSRSDIRAFNAEHKWCTPVPETQIRVTRREALRIRLGIDFLPETVSVGGVPALDDAAAALMLSRFPATAEGDKALRMAFQTIYCAIPVGGFTSNDQIDAWNDAHKFCTPIPHIAAVATRGRAALQAQLGLPSLPSFIDLTEDTANALLALPASQMVDAFRQRFCNPPVFRSNSDRNSWLALHPWCPNPPAVQYSPWLWVGGAVVVGGLAWWVVSSSDDE